MSKPANPPLFVSDVLQSETACVSSVSTDITLRDLFAAFALVALQDEQERSATDEKRAHWAYNMADAMLREREKP